MSSVVVGDGIECCLFISDIFGSRPKEERLVVWPKMLPSNSTSILNLHSTEEVV